MRIFTNRRTMLLLIIDILIFSAVFSFSAFLQYISPTRNIEFISVLIVYAVSVVLCIAARICMGIYTNVWRYANTGAYVMMVLADSISGILTLLVTLCFNGLYLGLWETAAIFAMSCLLTLTSRFCYQLKYRSAERKTSSKNQSTETVKVPVAIVGAGQTGSMVAEELLYSSHSDYTPAFFIDNDPCKVGGTVAGIKVYSEADAREMLEKRQISNVIIALPSAQGSTQKAIIDYYDKFGCKVKIYDFPIGNDSSPETSSKRVIRDVSIEDLLFRERIDVVDTDAADFYRGKTVLVTGGGGSIGSELCRQIAKCSPKKLVILDIYENNAYDIQQELSRQWGEKLDLAVEIASVRDRERLDAVFGYYKPEIVFHAAAHKHVPLMEHSNCEAIKNNVFGTRNTADMAEKHGVEKFVLVSTDKAVNPTNVMGATKRMCEFVIGCRKDSATAFCAVRFGNVLGSNGSVVPLFKRQIAEGGPITITDKRVVRYFMTIPEAAGLVVQAGSMAKRGTLFVLDMGNPVKILGLAETMIKLSGLVPYEDVDIVEVGLRPGEKLYEELLIKSETLTKTENDLIFIEEDVPPSREEVDEKLEMLSRVIAEEQGRIASSRITEALRSAVPTFRSPDEVNVAAENTREMQLAKG